MIILPFQDCHSAGVENFAHMVCATIMRTRKDTGTSPVLTVHNRPRIPFDHSPVDDLDIFDVKMLLCREVGDDEMTRFH
jgi:hypothetical protein